MYSRDEAVFWVHLKRASMQISNNKGKPFNFMIFYITAYSVALIQHLVKLQKVLV